MPRPRKINRPVDFHVMLPEDIAGRMSLHLFSEAEGRIPRGRLSSYIEQLIRRDLESQVPNVPRN